MSASAELPVWLIVVLTIAPAVIAGSAATTAAWLAGSRKAAAQLDRWRRREETMRLLRWAADKATSENDTERMLALSSLEALSGSAPDMLQEEDQALVEAVLGSVLSGPSAVVAEYSLGVTTHPSADGEVDHDG